MSAKVLVRRFAPVWAFLLLAGLAPSVQATPQIRQWTLDNGARVLFVESHEIPMLQITAVFDAGAARDRVEKSGLAALTNRLLREGAGKLNADEIAVAFEDKGAEFATDSQRDMAIASLRSLSDRDLLQPAVKLFAQVLAAPTFPPESLERERQRALIGLQQNAQSPGDQANIAFYRSLYGTHPYAQRPEGTKAGLEAIERDDLLAFHRQYYVGSNAILAIVGDTSIREARRIARHVLGALPKGEHAAALPPVAEPDPGVDGKPQHIAFPSTQSHILMGEVGMSRNDPDYFPLYVGNYVLGGSGLVSRLSDEVREKRGLSYSVYSYFVPMRERGPFSMGLQTRNKESEHALQVMRDTLDKFVADGPTEKELADAKKNLSGGFPLRLDSNGKIADNLAMIGFYGLPLDYLDTYIDRVEAVTVQQVRDAFKRRIHPAHMVTVIVGGADR
jgi:zinc protease